MIMMLVMMEGMENKMGLCFNSGPKWEDDTLNDLNIESIEANAREMCNRTCDIPPPPPPPPMRIIRYDFDWVYWIMKKFSKEV
jgi:hypothetical protein